jgi:hypothetical protein
MSTESQPELLPCAHCGAQPSWSPTLLLVGGPSTARGTTAASVRRFAAPHPGQSSTGTGVTGRSPEKESKKTAEILYPTTLEAERR